MYCMYLQCIIIIINNIIIIIKSLFQVMPIKVRYTIAQKSAQIVNVRVHVRIITTLRAHTDVAKKVYICKHKHFKPMITYGTFMYDSG